MDVRRDGANRLGDVVQRRKSEDERYPIPEAPFRCGQKRESRSARHPYESARPAATSDRETTSSTALRACTLATGVQRSDRAGPRAPRGSPNDLPPRDPARSRGAPGATPSSRHPGKEHDCGPGRRSSPGPVDERRRPGHDRVLLAHVPGQHPSDASEHGPVVRGSQPERKASLRAGERAPVRRASTHVSGQEPPPRLRAAEAAWRAPPG